MQHSGSGLATLLDLSRSRGSTDAFSRARCLHQPEIDGALYEPGKTILEKMLAVAEKRQVSAYEYYWTQ